MLGDPRFRYFPPNQRHPKREPHTLAMSRGTNPPPTHTSIPSFTAAAPWAFTSRAALLASARSGRRTCSTRGQNASPLGAEWRRYRQSQSTVVFLSTQVYKKCGFPETRTTGQWRRLLYNLPWSSSTKRAMIQASQQRKAATPRNLTIYPPSNTDTSLLPYYKTKRNSGDIRILVNARYLAVCSSLEQCAGSITGWHTGWEKGERG